MADIYICKVHYCKVHYSDDNTISKVKVKFRKLKYCEEFELPTPFIIGLLKTEKLSIKTLIYNNNPIIGTEGDNVTLYGDKFITTDGNGKETDNLENLPRF